MPEKSYNDLERTAIEWYKAKIEFIIHRKCADCKKSYKQAEEILSAKAAALLTAKEFGLKRKKMPKLR